MSIDCFLRLAPKTPLRAHLAAAVVARWLEDPDVQLHLFFMQGTCLPASVPVLAEMFLPEDNFHWTTRIFAEERAQGRFYLFADDDELLLGENWAQRMFDAMTKADGYGLLSARSVIASERMETSEFTGCPCIVRKAAVDYRLLDGPANKQDEIVCRAMHANGWKTDFIHGVADYTHLGFGFSQVNPALWNRC